MLLAYRGGYDVAVLPQEPVGEPAHIERVQPIADCEAEYAPEGPEEPLVREYDAVRIRTALAVEACSPHQPVLVFTASRLIEPRAFKPPVDIVRHYRPPDPSVAEEGAVFVEEYRFYGGHGLRILE